MPTYEFRCPNGHEFERFYRKISDGASSVECPECHEMAERRMSVGAGLLFKGSGFYITDYGKDGKKDQRDAAKAAESKAESKSESKPESKPESKSESSAPAKSESAPAAKAADKPAPPKKTGGGGE